MTTFTMRRATALAAVAVAFASVVASATPIIIGPWAFNHLLCSSSRCFGNVSSVTGEEIVNQGNLIGFWQDIVAADGYGSVCTVNGIDGHFGSRTEANTKAWQAAFDVPGLAALQADGIVGPHTWTAAQKFVVVDGLDGFTNYQHYDGGVYNIYFEYTVGVMFWDRPSSLTGPILQDSDHPGIGFGTC
jgi:hypothetical protein